MQPLSKEEQEAYDNAKYCHICKKVWGKSKNYEIMIIIQVNLEVQRILM